MSIGIRCIPFKKIDQCAIQCIDLFFYHSFITSIFLFFLQGFIGHLAQFTLSNFTIAPISFSMSINVFTTQLADFWPQPGQESLSLFCILYFAPLKKLFKKFKMLLSPFLGFLFNGVKLHSDVIYINISIFLYYQNT